MFPNVPVPRRFHVRQVGKLAATGFRNRLGVAPVPMNSSWWNNWDSQPVTVALPHLADGAAAASPPVGALIEELSRRWQSGERPLVEQLLAAYPGLEDQEAVVLRLIQEEYAL